MIHGSYKLDSMSLGQAVDKAKTHNIETQR